MKKTIISSLIFGTLFLTGIAWALPVVPSYTKELNPDTDNKYYLGTTTLRYKGLNVFDIFSYGTTTFATTSAYLLDTGGQVCNVKAYGAVGDNSTDDYTAIMSAISACPEGGKVYFPAGVYRVSQTIVIDRRNTTLEGSHAPRWQYRGGSPTSIKPTATFVGTSIIHIRDNSISGETNDNDGGRILNIGIDGNSYGTGITGIYFEGLVRDWIIRNVDVSQTSGSGIVTDDGAGDGYPRGFVFDRVSVYSPTLHGLRLVSLTDSYLNEVLTVASAQYGFYITSPAETKLVNSRAVFNALDGMFIDGSNTMGGFQVVGFSTDRNDRNGIRITATGTSTIAFSNLLTRRDGANSGGGTSAPYAGVKILGSAGNEVVPVIIDGLSQVIGVDDGGGGTLSPGVGVYADYGKYVKINGLMWGTSTPYTNGGNNTYFKIGLDTQLKTGYNTPTIYNDAIFTNATTTNLTVTGTTTLATTTIAEIEGDLDITGNLSAAWNIMAGRFISSPYSVVAPNKMLTGGTGEFDSIGDAVAAGTGPYTGTGEMSGRFLYVPNYNASTISMYSINQASGALTSIGDAVACTNSYEINADPTGRFVYASNYTANTVSMFLINQTTGALTSIGAAVAAGTNPYAVTTDPTGKFAYVTNFNGANISMYSINQTTGALTSLGTVASGNKPRGITVDPTGRFTYVSNNGAATISLYSINQTTGVLTSLGSDVAVQTQPIGIVVEPTGRFLYVVNRNSNSISMFSINQNTGLLTSLGSPVATGNTPLGAAVTPVGRFLAVNNSADNTISLYTINQATGLLTWKWSYGTGNSPRAVVIEPSGRFMYAMNYSANTVSMYSINNFSAGSANFGFAVGIGTTRPADMLHLYRISDNNHGLVIDAQGTQSNQTAQFTLMTLGDGTKNYGNAGAKGWVFGAFGNAFYVPEIQNDVHIAYWNGSTYLDAMNIDSLTGNVGIGTITPAQKLDVNGNINVRDGYKYLYNGISMLYASTTLSNYFGGLTGNQTMTGTYNTAFGSLNALHDNTTGIYNNAFGSSALFSNTEGNNNVAIGSASLPANTTGNYNTAVGNNALANNISGDNNTAIGHLAGENLLAGDNNILIGSNANIVTTTSSNFLNIGDTIYGNLATGNVGIGTTTPAQKLDVNGSIQISNGNYFILQRGAGTNRDIGFYASSVWDNLGILTVRPTSGTNVGTSLMVSPRGTGYSGSNKAQINILNTDFVADPSNYESLNLRGEGDKFEIFTEKMGTGTARPLYFSSTGSSGGNTMILATNGNVGIGTVSPSVKLHVSDGNALHASLTTALSTWQVASTRQAAVNALGTVTASNTATERGLNAFLRARGTLGTPLVVQNNDYLGDLLFGGYDGSTAQYGGGVFGFVDGTPSAGSIPTRISFVTGNNSADRLERLTIKSDGKVGIGTTTPSAKLSVELQSGVFANFEPWSVLGGAVILPSLRGSGAISGMNIADGSYFFDREGDDSVGIGFADGDATANGAMSYTPSIDMLSINNFDGGVEMPQKLTVNGGGVRPVILGNDADNYSLMTQTGDGNAYLGYSDGTYSWSGRFENIMGANEIAGIDSDSDNIFLIRMNTEDDADTGELILSGGGGYGSGRGGKVLLFGTDHANPNYAGMVVIDSEVGVLLNPGGLSNVGIGTTTPRTTAHIEDQTATTSLSISSGASGKGGRIILEDITGGTCTEITTSAGAMTSKAITCPTGI